MRTWIVVPLAVLSLSACQGSTNLASNSTPANPLSSATRRTAAACVLVKQDEATSLFGRFAEQAAVGNAAGAASVCAWRASTDPDPNATGSVTYSLLIYVFDDVAHYSETSARDARHLDGIGEKAFTFQASDLLTAEFVYLGQTVSIRYSITGLTAHPDPGSNIDKIIALATAAAGRM